MNVNFAIEISEESVGKFRVVAKRNGTVVYTAERTSGTHEKAEKRAHKVLADLLRDEARSVAERHPFAFPAELQPSFDRSDA